MPPTGTFSNCTYLSKTTIPFSVCFTFTQVSLIHLSFSLETTGLSFIKCKKKCSFNLRLTLIFKAKPCCSNLDLFRSCIAMMHFYNFLVVLPIPTTIHIQMYYFITVCVHLCGVYCDFFVVVRE